MTRLHLILFAALTGLHLALLQFCYFFLLLINVTSTYITYMTVVLSWMTGTLLGLWLCLNAEVALILGVVSYYAVYGLVLADPLSPWLLPIAAAGVMVTGFWAGRFFVVMQPWFGRSDRLFFHENNGFMVGIVAVFLGFTLLGQAFLLGTPLVSVLLLLGYWMFLRTQLTGGDEECGRADTPTAAVRLRWLRQAGQGEIVRFACLMVALNVLIPLGLGVYALATGRDYAPLFWNEDNLMTWFSSVQLMIIGLIAWLNREMTVLLRRLSPGAPGRAWIWWVFMLGFFFLALDERFRIHEQVRDRWLKPGGFFTGYDYLRPGDVGLYFYLIVGLVFAAFLVAELRRYRWAPGWFAAAVGVAISVTVIDSLPESVVGQWPMPRFWSSVFEEVAELTAQLLFLLSFLSVLHGKLGEWDRKQQTASLPPQTMPVEAGT